MKKSLMIGVAVLFAVCAVLVFAGGGGDDCPQAAGGKTQENAAVELFPLVIGDFSLSVEVADTSQRRSLGLMFRRELPADRGMLFVFPEPDMYCFWMRNTFIPLDIAFINEDWIIVDIQSMYPLSEELVCPPVEVLYALEVNQGWFEEKSIANGVEVELSESLRSRFFQ